MITGRGDVTSRARARSSCLQSIVDLSFHRHRRRTWRRHPQCDAEAVLHQAGLEARSVAAFLHENVLEFVAEEGIDSAADVMAYLSDAGAWRAVQRSRTRQRHVCRNNLRQPSVLRFFSESDPHHLSTTIELV